MQLILIICCVFVIVKRKKDFLIVLFIISLSFSAFNINLTKYSPGIGYFIPWIAISDLLLGVMVSVELIKICMLKSTVKFPIKGNKSFIILIGSLVFSYLVMAPEYYVYQSNGFYSLLCVIKGYVILIYFYNYFSNIDKYKVVVVSFAFVTVMQFGFMVYQWVSGDVYSFINLFYKTLEGTPIENYGATRKAFGTFAYPSIAAGVIIIIYPVAIAFSTMRNRNNISVIISKYIIIFLAPVCILLSGMRIGLIAMFIIIPFLLYILIKYYGVIGKNKLIIFPTLAALIALIFMSVTPLSEQWKDRFSKEDFLENSLSFRLLMPKIGMRSLDINPLFGVGWGNGDKYAVNLLKPGEEELYTVGLHNGYVAMVVENGIIGLIIYIAWYVSMFMACIRKNTNYDTKLQFAFLGGVIIIIIIQSLLVDVQGILLRTPAEYYYFCVCLAFLRGYDDLVYIRK
jgi:O-antigen ligase